MKRFVHPQLLHFCGRLMKQVALLSARAYAVPSPQHWVVKVVVVGVVELVLQADEVGTAVTLTTKVPGKVPLVVHVTVTLLPELTVQQQKRWEEGARRAQDRNKCTDTDTVNLKHMRLCKKSRVCMLCDRQIHLHSHNRDRKFSAGDSRAQIDTKHTPTFHTHTHLILRVQSS